jgi:hypothetical protein
VLPDLTVRIKKVTCFDGHVSVKLRLQNLQNGNIGITIPFETQVKVGGLTAVIPSGASVQNPWYNGQEKGANLFPGYGTFQVAAVIDFTSGTGLVPEANEGNNVAPSPMNAFDTNPSPLFVTCDKPGDQGNAEGESPEKKPVRKKKKGEARRKAASSEGGPRLLRDPRGLPPTPVRARPTPR